MSNILRVSVKTSDFWLNFSSFYGITYIYLINLIFYSIIIKNLWNNYRLNEILTCEVCYVNIHCNTKLSKTDSLKHNLVIVNQNHVRWPPRSPDLRYLDFLVEWLIKDKVIKTIEILSNYS